MRQLAKTDANLSGQKIQGWNVIRRVLPYLWPSGNTAVKVRVVTSMIALLLSQVIAVLTPQFFSQAAARCDFYNRRTGRAADIGVADIQSHPPPFDALPHNAKDGWLEPDHRAWREGGRVPAAVLAVLGRPLDLAVARHHAGAAGDI